MMRADRAAFLALILCGTAAGAVPVPVPQAGVAKPAGDVRTAITEAYALGQKGDCAGLLARLDPVVPGLAPGADRNAVQLLRLNCLAPAGRGGELAAVQAELVKADPTNPIVRGFGILIAADAGDMKGAGEQLAVLAEKTPDGLSGISGRLWRAINQTLSESKDIALRDRIAVALARADWQPTDLPELRGDVAEAAVSVLVRRGEVVEAGQILPRVTSPESLFELAILRDHAPIWPQLEEQMGPQSGRAIDAFAADRLAAFAAQPDDLQTRLGAVRAFVLLGRYREASETAASVAVANGMGEDAVSTVRLDAQALGMTGGRAAAIARLQPFATLDFARTPVAVSGMIALAETLDEADRAADALTAARAGLTLGGPALSPWGAAWLRRTEACSLAALGRAGEAKVVTAALRAKPDDNPAAAIEASLCAKEDGDAEKVAVATLATADGAAMIADQFQPDDALWVRNGSRLRALWTAFLKRPAVAAAFEKRARILPQALRPAAEPRAIPRAGGSGVPTA
ncbi:hypothetical protein [Sphingomonas prati]|uniref:Tetratricopeptide repeat protein n=1 Tax=Sphingomonas prati TaxID=1843237 RepID=A0A7W9BUA2_9SPHN|nr:hypothetical protein [Sphingomonas prati]MBB5730136.1 hypothetical protein [Sphingomonas prati]GGE91760.1 hypothetical protein GCM10011404_25860 [Sphingomonas prati]